MNFNDRYWVLDTETTGLDPLTGDKLIEIGALELDEHKAETGRIFHEFVDPEREIPEAAVKVHKKRRDDCIQLGGGQKFKHVAERFYSLIRGSTLVIHKADFDVGFINHELKLLNESGYRLDPEKHFGDTQFRPLEEVCKIFCSLKFANAKYPNSRNNLDALSKRYGIKNERKDEHGAFIDSQLLIQVWRLLTQQQQKMEFTDNKKNQDITKLADRITTKYELPVYSSDLADIDEHIKLMSRVGKESGGNSLWK